MRVCACVLAPLLGLEEVLKPLNCWRKAQAGLLLAAYLAPVASCRLRCRRDTETGGNGGATMTPTPTPTRGNSAPALAARWLTGLAGLGQVGVLTDQDTESAQRILQTRLNTWTAHTTTWG